MTTTAAEREAEREAKEAQAESEGKLVKEYTTAARRRGATAAEAKDYAQVRIAGVREGTLPAAIEGDELNHFSKALRAKRIRENFVMELDCLPAGTEILREAPSPGGVSGWRVKRVTPSTTVFGFGATLADAMADAGVVPEKEYRITTLRDKYIAAARTAGLDRAGAEAFAHDRLDQVNDGKAELELSEAEIATLKKAGEKVKKAEEKEKEKVGDGEPVRREGDAFTTVPGPLA